MSVIVAEFKECRYCKVDTRLMQSVIDEEVAKGNVDAGALGATRMEIHSIINPLKPPIAGARIPSARVTKDICTTCGRELTVRIEKGHMTLPLTQGQQPTFM